MSAVFSKRFYTQIKPILFTHTTTTKRSQISTCEPLISVKKSVSISSTLYLSFLDRLQKKNQKNWVNYRVLYDLGELLFLWILIFRFLAFTTEIFFSAPFYYHNLMGIWFRYYKFKCLLNVDTWNEQYVSVTHFSSNHIIFLTIK